MTSLLTGAETELSKMVLTSTEPYTNEVEDIGGESTLTAEAFIIENAKCFLCDRNFVEGEGTFLIFESRLRDDGGIDNPLSFILSTALGRDLDETSAHSALLCEACNKNVIEFEKLLQKFCEMRIRIITSYNQTVEGYNIEPILIDFDGEISHGDKTEVKDVLDSIIFDEAKSKKESLNIITPPNESQRCWENNGTKKNNSEVLVKAEQILQDPDLVEEIIDNETIVGECIISHTDSEVRGEYGESGFVKCNDIDSDLRVNAEQDVTICQMRDEFNGSSSISGVKSEESLMYDPDCSNNSASILHYTMNEENSDDEHDIDENARFGKIKTIFEQQDNIYFCLLCKERKAMVADPFTEHMIKNHGIHFYTCEFCFAGFLSNESLKEHVDKVHSHLYIAMQENSEEYQCNICQQVFVSQRLLRLHKRTHNIATFQYECSECQKKYSCRNLLIDHMNTHTGERPYKCTKCPKKFASNYTLQAHIKIHSERLRPYKCDKCNKAFLNQQTLTHHKKLHLGEKSFICDICSKAFGTQHNLDVHKIVHSGQRPFICRTCGKSFSRRAEIKDHERIHTGEKPYKCDMCDAAFAQRSNLMTHRKSTHLNEKLHKCDQCGRSFKRRRLLQYHINAVHTGVRPHECEICGSSFVYPEHKKKHMLIHGNSKPYTCEVCGKEFNSCANRNAHRFVHSSKKPYECLKCGAGFMRKPLLLAHMKHAGHTNDTIIINQPHINDKGTLTLGSEMIMVDSHDTANEQNEVPVHFLQESNTSVCNETLQSIPQSTADIICDVAETDSVQYLEFDDLDKDGHQIITWVDIRRDKEEI
ncbi:zinc finger and SCAN domain-containing protein 2-like isoform X1 [Anastrepha obliqua]|uniref:zinc finger and SCAN domain-containing protein 2-like isoform X1 n=1 Tax=Anastrepha obliqua TaxID=95512 RepID=UPI00240A7398|nr:zinc finger and SCAN domain-containing protein 2-like isoform X1 [Anastrepha obliqua]XP_054738187.1 zinc finger and SCAN domain-containing protein 2-like isoform X1 [Anastrepha obliqua]